MSQYLVKVGPGMCLHYYGKTLSLCGSCIHRHAASTVFADFYRPPFEIFDLDRHWHSLNTVSLRSATHLACKETRPDKFNNNAAFQCKFSKR